MESLPARSLWSSPSLPALSGNKTLEQRLDSSKPGPPGRPTSQHPCTPQTPRYHIPVWLVVVGPLRKTDLQRHTTCRPAETDVSHTTLGCYRQTIPSLCLSSPRVCQSPLAQRDTSHYSPCDGAHPSQHSTHCLAGRLDDSERPAASTARLAFIALETNSCKSCDVSQTSTHAAHTALNMHPASPLGTVQSQSSQTAWCPSSTHKDESLYKIFLFSLFTFMELPSF